MNNKNDDLSPIKRVEDLFNRRYLVRSVYAFGTGLALIAAYFVFRNFDSLQASWRQTMGLLTPFIWGICIAYILMPLFNALDAGLLRIKPLRRHPRMALAASAAITILLFLAMLGVFFSLVIPEIINSIRSLVNILTNSSYDWVRQYLQTAEEYLARFGVTEATLQEKAPNDLFQMFENPEEYLNKLLSYTLGIVFKAGASVKNILLAFIVSVYMLIGKDTFLAQSRKIIFACTTQDRAEHFIDFCRRTNRIFSGFISGKLLDSLIIGMICLIGMRILRLEYSMLISLIIGVTNVIPFFGPFIGAIPSILLLLIISPKQALVFLVFVLALQQFDGNILGPKILGNATGLTSFWVVFAVIVMGGMLGVVGMFVGVPIFATLYMVIKNTVEGRLSRKGLPISTRSYRDIK